MRERGESSRARCGMTQESAREMLSAGMGDMRPCSIAADSSTCLLLVHRGWKIGRLRPQPHTSCQTAASSCKGRGNQSDTAIGSGAVSED